MKGPQQSLADYKAQSVNIVVVIIAVIIALVPVFVVWRMAQATARTVYALKSQVENFADLEKKVAKQNRTMAGYLAAIDRLRVDLAAQKTIIAFQGEGIRKLQAEVATWKRKFDAVIAWVRTIAPGADVDEFLAQLEAGPGG